MPPTTLRIVAGLDVEKLDAKDRELARHAVEVELDSYAAAAEALTHAALDVAAARDAANPITLMIAKNRLEEAALRFGRAHHHLAGDGEEETP